MPSITEFSISPLLQSHYITPVRLHYKQNGIAKTWEAVQSYDSVAVLLYHTQRKALVLVKQFRAPVFMNDKKYLYTYELCAGILDKECSIEQIAKEEIDEECGYDVPLKSIKKITSFFTNVGVSGTKQHLFYAAIDESMHVHSGGGIENEEITVEYLPLKDAKKFMYDDTKAKTPGLLFAFEWFFQNVVS